MKEVSWSEVSDDTIRGFIELAEHFDGAVRFGRSRDRGVFSVGLYIGDERFTEWIPGGDDASVVFDTVLREIYEDYDHDHGVD